ncbi:transposase, partial [Salmonella enterica subsp. enterica serovar Typhimurium]|nr:transposase [Salmonella enterica subsp. enterica serovar Typhimurium]
IDKSKTQDELLEEIAYLRAEVALLKKQRALRLESEAVAQKRLLKSSRN